MKIKDIIKQYKNDELCQKWNNNIPASELEDFTLLTDSQDIQSLYDDFPFLPSWEHEEDVIHDIEGILLSIEDGDYKEVYVTESNNPYSLDAIYHPLDYYLDEE